MPPERRDPSKLSARAKQDAALKIEIRRVFDENFSSLWCAQGLAAVEA